MKIEIIAVGSELTNGRVINTNTSKIASIFSRLGFLVNHHHIVKDDENEIAKSFLSACKRSDIIIFTGGLGPTFDDITKETIFKVLNLTPVLNEKAYTYIKKYCENRSKKVGEFEKKQAMIPEEVELVPNDVGSAPGCLINSEYNGKNRTIILLPGPPFEMETMLNNHIVPYLQKKLDIFCASKTIKLCDITEVEVEKRIKNFVENTPIEVGIYDKPAYVELCMSYRSNDKIYSDRVLKEVSDKILYMLRAHIINTNSKTLEEEIVVLLKKRQLTVSFCESCTGGSISAKVTSVPSSSSILKFSQVTYHKDKKIIFSNVNEKILKEKTEVSQEIAGQMAIGTMKKAESDLCVSVTGVAGPSRGPSKHEVGTVFIAVCSSEKIIVKRFDFPSSLSRKQIIELATNSALIMLFKFILGKDIKHGYVYSIGDFMKTTNQSISRYDNKNLSKRKKILLNIILYIFFAIFSIGLWEIGKYFYESISVKMSNSNLASKYNEDIDSTTDLPNGYLKKFAYLYSVNQDVKGYIKINNTRIDYPIVQATNNDYYLTKNFNGKYSRYGSIFFDYRSNIENMNTNTIIYGHNMKDGQMFSDLVKYKDINFYKNNPTLQFDTVYELGEYEIFAAILVNVNPQKGEVFDYTNKLKFDSDKEFTDYISEIKRRSVIDTGVNVIPGDTIITVSTCDNVDNIDSRFAIFAKKKEKDSASLDSSITLQNQDELIAQDWYEKSELLSTNEEHLQSVSTQVSENIQQDSIQSSGNDVTNDFQQSNENTPPQNSNVPLNGVFTFTTYGYGHGVGMSQYGANEYAKMGWSYSKILKHYYTGISIEDKGLSSGTTLKVNAGGQYIEGSVTDILASVVTAEVGTKFNTEAIKAQAIASHTYIKNANLSGSIPHVPFKDADQNVFQQCKSVENKILTYNGNIVYTPYCSMTSGMTQSSKDMWGGDYPWLVPVDSYVDRNVSKPTYYMNYQNQYKISVAELKIKLQQAFSISLSDNPSNWFKDIKKNSSGYVIYINIDDKITVRGRDIREKIFTTQSFKSHAFDVSYSS